MKKLVLAAVCAFALVGFVLADEFNAQIVNVKGNSITYYKTAKGKGKGKGGGGGGKKGAVREGDAITTTASASAKVAKGMYSKDDMKYNVGDPVDGGLKAEMFKAIDQEKGVNVHITIADDGTDKGKITQILLVGGKKKKGG